MRDKSLQSRRRRQRSAHERQVHEISLNRRDVGVRIARIQLVAPIDLVRIERDAGDLALQELGNVARRPRNAATDVENLFGVSKAVYQLGRQLVFVASNGFVKGLVGKLVAEMEGGSPSPFVKDGGQIVVSINELLVRRDARFRVGLAMQSAVLVNAVTNIVGTRQSLFLQS